MSGSAATTGQPIDAARALAEHSRWLRTVVAARLGEPQAVDELMQEISAALFARPIYLVDQRKTTAFLYRLAVRQVLLYRRRCGRGRRTIERYANYRRADEFAPPMDPLDWLLAEERRQLVREALLRLPDQDAEILMLKYAEHWSCKEMATRLDIAVGAIEARLHRARKRLRHQLATMGICEAAQ